MTTAELQNMLEADFLGFDALETLTYVDAASPSSGTVYLIASARMTFQVVKQFGEVNVKGYQIDKVQVTFPYDNFTHVPKLGDRFGLGGNIYEVTEIANKSAYTRWLVTGERAFIETDWATSIDQQRATLSVDVAGTPTETWANVASLSAVVMYEDDVADMINRLGVAGDKQATTVFIAQTATIRPMDRIVIGSRPYRITMIGDEGRVARLLKVRVEQYA